MIFLNYNMMQYSSMVPKFSSCSGNHNLPQSWNTLRRTFLFPGKHTETHLREYFYSQENDFFLKIYCSIHRPRHCSNLPTMKSCHSFPWKRVPLNTFLTFKKSPFTFIIFWTPQLTATFIIFVYIFQQKLLMHFWESHIHNKSRTASIFRCCGNRNLS